MTNYGKMTRRVKADLPGRAQGAPGRSLAARSLILKLVSLRHGDKALCATQNLFFKRAAVEFVVEMNAAGCAS